MTATSEKQVLMLCLIAKSDWQQNHLSLDSFPIYKKPSTVHLNSTRLFIPQNHLIIINCLFVPYFQCVFQVGHIIIIGIVALVLDHKMVRLLCPVEVHTV